MTRRLLQLLIILAIASVFAVPQVRGMMLSQLGGLLVVTDPVQAPIDTVIVTHEADRAGLIEASDLYRELKAKSLVLLEAERMEPDQELARRGVKVPNLLFDVLRQLGVPSSAVIELPAGEGGTTENTAALAAWAVEHKPGRSVVIVSPTHGRRYHRALARVWPANLPLPAVVVARHAAFRPADWWQQRTTLRDGLFEMQKLALDYLTHPF